MVAFQDWYRCVKAGRICSGQRTRSPLGANPVNNTSTIFNFLGARNIKHATKQQDDMRKTTVGGSEKKLNEHEKAEIINA